MLDPGRAGAFDVVLGRVADHRGRSGIDTELLEQRAEDRRVRLRPAERARAERGVDLEPMVRDEPLEVAPRVRHEPELQPLRPQLVEHRERVLVQLEVLGVLPGLRHLDRAVAG